MCNRVLAESKKSVTDLKIQIDEHLYAVDVKTTPELFVTSWNAATRDPAMAITEDEGRITVSIFKWKYFWCLGPMITACRHVLADEVRTRFDVAAKASPYVSDKVTHACMFRLVTCII